VCCVSVSVCMANWHGFRVQMQFSLSLACQSSECRLVVCSFTLG
jgi:hypothetical protein